MAPKLFLMGPWTVLAKLLSPRNELCQASCSFRFSSALAFITRSTQTSRGPEDAVQNGLGNRHGLLLLQRTELDFPRDLTICMDMESNPGDMTPNSEERLWKNQCIIPSAGGYANFQNAEPIVYSSQYLFSLKSCASVLPWADDVKNCLSDLGIARRKLGKISNLTV